MKPHNFAELISETTATNWNVHDHLKDRKLCELKSLVDNDRLPFAVCVLNVTGDLNVGMMMRTASILGANHFIILGRRRYDKRSTVGAQNYVKLSRIDALNDDLSIDRAVFEDTMSRWDYTPVFVETSGTSLYAMDWRSIKNPCLIFGNEGMGIPQDIIGNNLCVSIPQRGVLRSLNVAVAAGIVMSHVSNVLG